MLPIFTSPFLLLFGVIIQGILGLLHRFVHSAWQRFRHSCQFVGDEPLTVPSSLQVEIECQELLTPWASEIRGRWTIMRYFKNHILQGSHRECFWMFLGRFLWATSAVFDWSAHDASSSLLLLLLLLRIHESHRFESRRAIRAGVQLFALSSTQASQPTRKRIMSRLQRMFLQNFKLFLNQDSLCVHMCRCLPIQELLLQRGWTGTLGSSPCKCPPNRPKSCRWANLLYLTLGVVIWCDWTALGFDVNLVRTTAEMVEIWGCAENWVEEDWAESANVLLQMRRDSDWRDQRGWW